jgi:hypothetical protein
MYTALLAKEATLSQPTLPQCHLFIHALNIFTMYRTAMSRPANKGIYKYIRNRIYRINKKEGNLDYPNGDLTKDVSTWSSTYVKTLTNKEKFPY